LIISFYCHYAITPLIIDIDIIDIDAAIIDIAFIDYAN
jgi:hypothetical protein